MEKMVIFQESTISCSSLRFGLVVTGIGIFIELRKLRKAKVKVYENIAISYPTPNQTLLLCKIVLLQLKFAFCNTIVPFTC